MEILVRIKRCALPGRVQFTDKDAEERLADGLSELEVCESIVNATRIEKTIRSTGLNPSAR